MMMVKAIKEDQKGSEQSRRHCEFFRKRRKSTVYLTPPRWNWRGVEFCASLVGRKKVHARDGNKMSSALLSMYRVLNCRQIFFPMLMLRRQFSAGMRVLKQPILLRPPVPGARDLSMGLRNHAQPPEL